MYESKIDNNGNLDLALSNDNEYKTCFDKTSESKIMLKTVDPKFSGGHKIGLIGARDLIATLSLS